MIDKRMKTFDIIIQICCICFIILIITDIVAPRFFKDVKEPSLDPTYSHIKMIENGIRVYKLNTGNLPNTLYDLIVCPKGLENVWGGPYTLERTLYDSWKRTFIYEPNTYDPNSYALISYGADGIPGGEGYNADIYND
jgi:general secretion pathway protein G